MISCPSCSGPIEKGKVLLCVACFESIPYKEREATRVLYVRLVRMYRDPGKVAAGMASKVEKIARLAREARGIVPSAPAIEIVVAPRKTETMRQVAAL